MNSFINFHNGAPTPRVRIYDEMTDPRWALMSLGDDFELCVHCDRNEDHIAFVRALRAACDEALNKLEIPNG
jgi:hypothetical protein